MLLLQTDDVLRTGDDGIVFLDKFEKRCHCSLIGEDEGVGDVGLGGSQKSLSRLASIGLGQWLGHIDIDR
jgi:hypothetical protein